ncbi:RagB/SusD family nutrient uptake outer membrane protein [Pinibacter aurantiacus]|uniref:RagB/SusD family nutrient uptake outer membrane protein n=1 Tax=Pinibacter aurantiacus TaxID=2851599 RepID=A0A9E2W3L0_9BACT|nr:RagB/SusD family nutrient uptake outer membrane protein [Pinibacter aurantiacus]MBV4358665.1 RagB/SusD family nutrient uptake outer membrane protein [Pinibacter aurantiacus]
MKKTLKICMVALLALSACKKLDLAPTNNYTDLNYWTSADKANLVLNTDYNQMTDVTNVFYNEALSDNAYNGRGDAQGVNSISAGIYDPALGRLKSEWGYHYQGIKTTNVLLENIDLVPNMDAALKARMIAEARFLRAFHYFQLATWFGDVPYFTKNISIEESRTIARTPRAEVIANVLKELDEIETVLPVNKQYTSKDVGRISKGAVIALKARIQLYESNWAAVVTECEKLISKTDNGTYGLFPSYEGLFLPQNKNSVETILGRGFVPLDVTHGEFIDFVPLSIGGRVNAMAPTQELVDDYLMANGKTIREAGSGYDESNPYVNRDPRLGLTIVYDNYAWKKPDGTTATIKIKPGSNTLDEYKSGTSSSPTGYYIRKYYDPTSGSTFASGNDVMLIRYADVLLMYAEAKNELGQMTGSIWGTTVGAVRQRAGFTGAALNFNAAWSKTDMQNIIRRERRAEFAMEGLRIFDIRRWKIAQTVLNGTVHGAKFGDSGVDNGYIIAGKRSFDPTKHYLWPVPRDERGLNPNLSQNPGWN